MGNIEVPCCKGSVGVSNMNPKQLEEKSEEENVDENVVAREKEEILKCSSDVAEETRDIVNEQLSLEKEEVLGIENGINQQEGQNHEEVVSDKQAESPFEAVYQEEKGTTSILAENSQSTKHETYTSESLPKADKSDVMKDESGIENINDNVSSTPKISMSEVASTTPCVEEKAEAAGDEYLNENSGKSDLHLKTDVIEKSSEEKGNSNVEGCSTTISCIQENLKDSTDKQCLSYVKEKVDSCIDTEQMEGNSLLIKDKNLPGKGTTAFELVDFDKDEMMTDSQLNMLDDEMLNMALK